MSRALLEFALEHAAGGRPVFPLACPLAAGGCSCRQGKACQNAGKHPALTGWQDWATTDAEAVRLWWTDHPRSNIGMPTGARSGVAVLDVDPRHGGDESLAALEREFGKLPGTVESLTGGGGRQVWFIHPDGLRNSAGELGAGLDIRGEGGLVVLPGSIHPSGRRYEWEASSRPDEVPLAPFPAWLLGRLTGQSPNGKRGPAPPVVELIRQGQRSNTLCSLAGSMRQRGMTPAEFLPALLAVNRDRCMPPLDEDDVRQIAESVGRYAPTETRTLNLSGERRERIVGGEVLLTSLRISRSSSPVYTATVYGRELRLSSEQLLTFRKFQLRCMEALDFIPAPPVRYDHEGKRLPPGAAWADLVNEALETLEEDPTPPEDASPEGAVWAAVRDFLAGGALSEDRGALLRAGVVIEGDYYLFRGEDLRRHLTLHHVQGWTPHGLWLIIRDRGGDNRLVKVNGQPVRIWRVLVAAVALPGTGQVTPFDADDEER